MVNGRTDAEDMERACTLVTLRDTFAAAALTGLLANEDLLADDDKVAETAYELADAMLRERDKTSAENTSGIGSVTLTDEEREAIEEGADALYGDSYDAEAATLRSLLERLG